MILGQKQNGLVLDTKILFPFWNWLNNATSMPFMLQLLPGTIHVNNFLCRFYIGDCANVLLICPETRMCHQHILHYMDCNSCLSDDDYIFTFTGMTYTHSTPLYLLFMKSSLCICFIYTGQQRSFILRNHGILHCFPLLVCSQKVIKTNSKNHNLNSTAKKSRV